MASLASKGWKKRLVTAISIVVLFGATVSLVIWTKKDSGQEVQEAVRVPSVIKSKSSSSYSAFEVSHIAGAIATKNKTLLADITRSVQADFPDNTARLDAMLGSPDREIREFAGVVLTTIGTDKAAELLIQSIKKEFDPRVRANLIESLQRITNSDAVPTLARYALDMSDLELHRACRNVLSSMTDPMTVSMLVAMLERESIDESLEPIAYAIAHMTCEGLIPSLVRGANSQDSRTATACIQGLGSIGSPEAFREILHLVASHDAGKKGLVARTVAVQTAADRKNALFVKACEEVLGFGRSIDVSRAALDIFVATPGHEARDAIERRLKQSSEALIDYATKAMERHQRAWPTPDAAR